MAKKGINKKSISLDMTAMCDMAFLLLTFFILTAKMKAAEPVQVEIPSSQPAEKVPEQGLIRITLAPDGRIFFGLSEFANRKEVLKQLNESKKIGLSADDLDALASEETIGMPVEDLKEYASLSPEERGDFLQEGIPADSANNELQYWITYAKSTNPNYKFGIKADQKTDYEHYNKVIRSLQELRYNKFSLITSLEQ
ncbi:MAG: biopolymer transporter ExbD [Cytophagaceae bacterium]|jgi:biopolymer transport protein ExbD|nr:biopolymer transporter ExbD [Cytophagaceae bacterium]